MRGQFIKRGIIFGMIILLISISVIPGISKNTTEQTKEKNIESTPLLMPEKTTSLSFYVFGKTGLEKHDIMVSSQDATQIYTQFQELNKELTAHPLSEKTRQIEREFLSLLKEKNVIPTGVSKEELLSLLQPPITPPHNSLKSILPFEGKASEWRCSFISQGTGSMVPIIILPRLIPILLTPIPRVLIRWNVKEGLTSCGGLYSGTGFIAYGEQKGFAVGFWGIGLTFSLPPIMNVYGLAGYAFYASVNADEIEHYPPNNPPEITQTDPANGQQMVPISTSELRFSIKDDDGDLMSYTVTTNPDIGSGSGGLKPDGVYSIPVSGLESLTKYTWHIQVSDGEDTTEKTLTFTTEPAAPIVSNPSPANDEREVSIDITQLQFKLKDYQGDAMEYTVQTSPNIGSDHKTNIHNGTYSVAVSGLTYGVEYRWYVNVTDGTYWTRKIYQFATGYPSPFDPFTYGWHYRKQITIDHTQVAEDLQNFTVLLSTTDPDLMKAQATGNDILFMNDVGAAVKLHHEIESFDASSGMLIAWINIPLLSSSQDTVFYLYYGNPNSIDQSYPQKTWDSHYFAVYHMKNGVDSTGNGNMLNPKGGISTTTGRIGNCYSFDGIDDFLTDIMTPPSKITVEVWFNSDVKDDVYRRIVVLRKDGQNCNCDLQKMDSANNNNIRFSGGDPDWELTVCPNTWITGSWYYTAATAQKNDQSKIYWNGLYAAQSPSPRSNDLDTTSGSELCIGQRGGLPPHGQDCRWEGKIDEVRISNIVRSAAWIQTSYATMNDPTNFLSIGPEEPGP